jgi:putative toxin-antitoxin system antitoxin component (TIGR02293 family)
MATETIMALDLASLPAAPEAGEGDEPARQAARLLGGAAVLGVEVQGEADFVDVLDRGVPLAALDHLARRALAWEEIERLIISRRALAARRAKGQTLTLGESERAVRAASIAALAEETFADEDKAHLWLRRANAALGGRRPLDLLETEPGARMVERLLYRTAYGIAA